MTTSAQIAHTGPRAGRLQSRPNSIAGKTAPARDSPIPACSVLREDPELAAAVPEPRRQDALRRCTAPALTITAENSGVLSTIQDHPGGLGLLNGK